VWFRVGGLMTSILVVGACGKPTADWQQDIYIWQRIWSASTQNSVDDLTPAVARHRVLVAQFNGQQAPVLVELDEALPALAGRLAVATVRIDGSRLDVAPDGLWSAIESQLTRLRGAGAELVALEIDHDTATAAVGDYAAWLARLRSELPGDLPLWITALPDWRNSLDIARLLDGVDLYTLQVHAVAGNGQWLMDGDLAMEWVNAFAEASATPFYVALPTYQLRAGLDGAGELRFLESEAVVPARAGDERMLFVPPRALAEWIATLKADAPDQLLGLAWFRLPVREDRANISLATLNALIEGRDLVSDIELLAEPVRPGASTFDLSLLNHGPHDTGWPHEIGLPADCASGEGANGFQVQRQPARLVHRQPGLLKAGEAVSAGWVRCSRLAGEVFESMAVTGEAVR